MPSNRYVDFVSDDHFKKCVKHVCDSYFDVSSLTNPAEIQKFVSRNSIDSFKMVFDAMRARMSFDGWMSFEVARQADKTVTNKVGDFHQMLLGGVPGWTDLKKGHPLGIDLEKDDRTIFIELKNKHNTVKGEDLKNVFDKLKKVADKHKKALVYYAYITPKNGTSGERIWKTSQRKPHNRIMEAWGSKVYEIVTRDKDALEKVWEAIPTAINDLSNNKTNFNKEQKQKFYDMFKMSFKR